MTYDDWYKQADSACSALSGFGIDDLADGNSYDAWSDGESPQEYARSVLRSSDYPEELL